jgi:hypothetical protein
MVEVGVIVGSSVDDGVLTGVAVARAVGELVGLVVGAFPRHAHSNNVKKTSIHPGFFMNRLLTEILS